MSLGFQWIFLDETHSDFCEDVVRCEVLCGLGDVKLRFTSQRKSRIFSVNPTSRTGSQLQVYKGLKVSPLSGSVAHAVGHEPRTL